MTSCGRLTLAEGPRNRFKGCIRKRDVADVEVRSWVIVLVGRVGDCVEDADGVGRAGAAFRIACVRGRLRGGDVRSSGCECTGLGGLGGRLPGRAVVFAIPLVSCSSFSSWSMSDSMYNTLLRQDEQERSHTIKVHSTPRERPKLLRSPQNLHVTTASHSNQHHKTPNTLSSHTSSQPFYRKFNTRTSAAPRWTVLTDVLPAPTRTPPPPVPLRVVLSSTPARLLLPTQVAPILVLLLLKVTRYTYRPTLPASQKESSSSAMPPGTTRSWRPPPPCACPSRSP